MASMHGQRRRPTGELSLLLLPALQGQAGAAGAVGGVRDRICAVQCVTCMPPHRQPRRSQNLMKWTCFIPGKPNTDWEGGFYPLTMEFSEDYPTKPPKVCGDDRAD